MPAPGVRRPAGRAGRGRRGRAAPPPRHVASRSTAPGPSCRARCPPTVVVGADGAHSLVRPGAARQAARAARHRDPRLRARHRRRAGGRQVIRYGDRRQPSYAWAFDRGDGLANVGYGELLPGDASRRGAQPPAAARPARAAGARRRQHRRRLARPPPAAEQLALGPARRPGPARRRRRRAGQPDDRRGHLLRRRHRHRRRSHRRPGGRARPARGRRRPPPRASYARSSAPTCATPGSPRGWPSRRASSTPGIRAAGRDRHVFDTLVEIGLGDGRIDPAWRPGCARGLVPPRPPDLPTRPTSRPARTSCMRILAARSALPPHSYPQAEITEAFADVISERSLDHALLRRFHRNAGVERRHTVLPLAEYADARRLRPRQRPLHRARRRARRAGAGRRAQGRRPHAVRRRPGRHRDGHRAGRAVARRPDRRAGRAARGRTPDAAGRPRLRGRRRRDRPRPRLPARPPRPHRRAGGGRAVLADRAARRHLGAQPGGERALRRRGVGRRRRRRRPARRRPVRGPRLAQPALPRQRAHDGLRRRRHRPAHRARRRGAAPSSSASSATTSTPSSPTTASPATTSAGGSATPAAPR